MTVSVACFVPKPFTPFEFEPQDTMEELRRKQKILLDTVSSRKISVKYHDSPTSFLEAALARGDRRLYPVSNTRGAKARSLTLERFLFHGALGGRGRGLRRLLIYANRRRAYDR